MQRRVRAAAAVLAAASVIVLSVPALGQEEVRLAPLHVIPTVNQSARPVPADGPARVRLTATDARALAEVLGVAVPAEGGSLEYRIDQYPQLRSSASRTWLEATFVIDFTEPEFETLREELAARGPRITRSQLVEYVAGLVDESNEREWDLASVVARKRTGDCSEHAVLTTALARLQGIPARVVLGVALVSEENRHGAFGHAWAELFEDGKWQVADAALSGAKPTVRYLPIGLIEDEGMGYAMELMRVMQIWIERVEVLGP
jgi:transglutaminase-like putative cysteine protease